MDFRLFRAAISVAFTLALVGGEAGAQASSSDIQRKPPKNKTIIYGTPAPRPLTYAPMTYPPITYQPHDPNNHTNQGGRSLNDQDSWEEDSAIIAQCCYVYKYGSACESGGARPYAYNCDAVCKFWFETKNVKGGLPLQWCQSYGTERPGYGAPTERPDNGTAAGACNCNCNCYCDGRRMDGGHPN